MGVLARCHRLVGALPYEHSYVTSPPLRGVSVLYSARCNLRPPGGGNSCAYSLLPALVVRPLATHAFETEHPGHNMENGSTTATSPAGGEGGHRWEKHNMKFNPVPLCVSNLYLPGNRCPSCGEWGATALAFDATMLICWGRINSPAGILLFVRLLLHFARVPNEEQK